MRLGPYSRLVTLVKVSMRSASTAIDANAAYFMKRFSCSYIVGCLIIMVSSALRSYMYNIGFYWSIPRRQLLMSD